MFLVVVRPMLLCIKPISLVFFPLTLLKPILWEAETRTLMIQCKEAKRNEKQFLDPL